jgi:hypothetical protein
MAGKKEFNANKRRSEGMNANGSEWLIRWSVCHKESQWHRKLSVPLRLSLLICIYLRWILACHTTGSAIGRGHESVMFS